MIPISRLYAITGATMVALLAIMILDQFVPTTSNLWIGAAAHPLVALISIAVFGTLIFERSVEDGTYMFFIATLIALFASILNEALISMVGTGTIPLALTVLASLSVRMPLAWIVVGVHGIALVVSAGALASSLLVAIIIGAAPTLLFSRWSDA